MVGYIDYVVDVVGDLVIVVFVMVVIVIGEIVVWVGVEICIDEVLVVVVDCVYLVWLGIMDDQVVFGWFVLDFVIGIDQCWLYVEEGQGG